MFSCKYSHYGSAGNTLSMYRHPTRPLLDNSPCMVILIGLCIKSFHHLHENRENLGDYLKRTDYTMYDFYLKVSVPRVQTFYGRYT